MASAPSSRAVPTPSEVVRAFAARYFDDSGAAQFGIDALGLALILAEVVADRGGDADTALSTLHLEELVLARACVAGNERAWEVFLTRYRGALYEAAHRIAHDEGTARALADSLYAGLYGLNERGEVRTSKLRYYMGRGSLAGWLRTVIAQEYVNQYRRTKRETSLDAAVEDGKQFGASQTDNKQLDPRVEVQTSVALAALDSEERLLLAAYYLDGRTLAEIARVLGVHESTVSRKLERAITGLRKGIRKRLIQAGMSARQADEAMQEIDVRDMEINVKESLGQDRERLTFYNKSGEEG